MVDLLLTESGKPSVLAAKLEQYLSSQHAALPPFPACSSVEQCGSVFQPGASCEVEHWVSGSSCASPQPASPAFITQILGTSGLGRWGCSSPHPLALPEGCSDLKRCWKYHGQDTSSGLSSEISLGFMAQGTTHPQRGLNAIQSLQH